jgi:hypothetical protein
MREIYRLQDGMTITEEDNDETETPYTAVSIIFAKKDIQSLLYLS